VHANDLVVDHGTAGEAVERVAELLPHLYGEATAALVVKAVNSIDAGTLVVSPEQEEVLLVLDFVRKEQAHHLQRLLPSIHVVSKKQIIGLADEISEQTVNRVSEETLPIRGHTCEATSGRTYLGREAPVLEQSKQVRVLPMHIAAYLYGCPKFQKHGLRHEHFPRLRAEVGCVGGTNVDGRPRSLAARRQEKVDHLVDPFFAGTGRVGGSHFSH
jgi:hypothetical protein